MPTMVILVLDNVDRLEEVLTAWWDAGASGITILESSGAARYFARRGVREDVPIFPGLVNFPGHREIQHRTPFTVLPDGLAIEKLFDVTDAVLGPLAQPHNGIMFALPVLHARGHQGALPKA
jgi:nitrogen regulatory protein P-II 1